MEYIHLFILIYINKNLDKTEIFVKVNKSLPDDQKEKFDFKKITKRKLNKTKR